MPILRPRVDEALRPSPPFRGSLRLKIHAVRSKLWFWWISFVCATSVFGTGCTALRRPKIPVSFVEAMLMLTRTLQLKCWILAFSTRQTLVVLQRPRSWRRTSSGREQSCVTSVRRSHRWLFFRYNVSAVETRPLRVQRLRDDQVWPEVYKVQGPWAAC